MGIEQKPSNKQCWFDNCLFRDEDPKNPLAIMVKKQEGFNPKYKIAVGSIRNKKFSEGLTPLDVYAPAAIVYVKNLNVSMLETLIGKANLYIKDCLQARHDEILAFKIARDTALLAQEQKVFNSTGRTERKKAAREKNEKGPSR